MPLEIQPGDWITGPFWKDPVQVISITASPQYGHAQVFVTTSGPNASRAYVFTDQDWQNVRRIAPAVSKGAALVGDPSRFALGIEAHRLRLAHSIDPYLALNAGRISPLPHQFEAIYEHLLSRPIVRALLAHDAGSGKTIMAGLLIKELKRRQSARRILIVAPAGLTIQWRRELLTKFGEDFTIVSRDLMEAEGLDSLDVWRRFNSAIVSVDFAKQRNMRQALESIEWDIAIIDEAHKMAAYALPNGTVRKTQTYELGEVISRHSTHFLLMTATPHKGDPDNYRLLIQLIDAEWGEASTYLAISNPIVLRRTKEEMKKADGSPLYPERIVQPLEYSLSPEEGDLFRESMPLYSRALQCCYCHRATQSSFCVINSRKALSIESLRITRISEAHEAGVRNADCA